MLIWFPCENLYLASGPYKPPPSRPMQPLPNHGVREEHRSGRDVIWFPHNTPGIPRGSANGLIKKTYRTDRGVATATSTILSEGGTVSEIPFLRDRNQVFFTPSVRRRRGMRYSLGWAEAGEGFLPKQKSEAGTKIGNRDYPSKAVLRVVRVQIGSPSLTNLNLGSKRPRLSEGLTLAVSGRGRATRARRSAVLQG